MRCTCICFFFLLGRMAILNGLAFLIPLLCAFSWGEPAYLYFGPSMAVTLALGGLMMGFGRRHSKQLGVAGGAWYMVLVWVMLGGVGMLPYLFSGSLSVADAFLKVFRLIRRSACLALSGRPATYPVRWSCGTA